MSKKLSKEELMAQRDEIIAQQHAKTRKSQRNRTLTKAERKVLGLGKDVGRAEDTNVRINPVKVNQLIKLIRGKSLDEALAILTYTRKSSSPVLIKLLKSAEANAVNNNNLDRDNLFVAEAYANDARTLKRIKPRARGSATRILKRSARVTVVLREQV